MPQYLVRNRHDSGWLFRVVVPAQLRPILGRSEVRRSLGDITRRQAARQAADIADRLSACFAALMRRRPEFFLSIQQLTRAIDGTVTATGVEFDKDNLTADVEALRAVLGGAGSAVTAPATRKPYAELVAAYVAEHVAGGVWTEKSRHEVEAVLRRYGEHCSAAGLDPHAKDAAVSFKTAQLPQLAARTLGKHLSRLFSLFDWAHHHGFAQDNPFAGLKPKRARGKSTPREEREAWSPAEIAALLGTLNRATDPCHWLVLLGVYSGARINELAQLYLDDVREEGGVHYLDINAATSDKRLKNAGSARSIPLHTAVIKAGFVEHVERLRSEGAGRLFEMWPCGRDGYGQAASRWFAKHRKQHDLTGVFHGLRHTAATQLRESGVEESTVNEILGHSYGKSQSFGRYAKSSSLGRLKDAIEKLRFDPS